MKSTESGEKLREWLDNMEEENVDMELSDDKFLLPKVDEIGHQDIDITSIMKIKYHDVKTTTEDLSLVPGTLFFSNRNTFEGHFSSGLEKLCGTLHRNQKFNHLSTTGTWISGRLEGKAILETCYGGYEETLFRNGVRHGLSRTFGPQPSKPGNLWRVASYVNGKMQGIFWQQLMGGGFLTGVPENNEMTGGKIAFLFPNFTDAILGSFDKGKLVEGVEVKLSSIDVVHGMATASFSQQEASKSVKRDQSTPYSIAIRPLTPDTNEHARVEVKQSHINDAGEGLFAKIDMNKGQVISLLNGIRVAPSLDEDWSDYKVHFNTEFDIDIPEDMRSLDKYCATLAHKANHSFLPNTRWGRMDHPR